VQVAAGERPRVQDALARVWLWDEWPGRSGRDIGIDLVAEDRDGGLWAIQAKHYDAAYSIKKADLDSFLAASSRPEFTARLSTSQSVVSGASGRYSCWTLKEALPLRAHH
jgi:predicted helicase